MTTNEAQPDTAGHTRLHSAESIAPELDAKATVKQLVNTRHFMYAPNAVVPEQSWQTYKYTLNWLLLVQLGSALRSRMGGAHEHPQVAPR
jgi:hypothetical protein